MLIQHSIVSPENTILNDGRNQHTEAESISKMEKENRGDKKVSLNEKINWKPNTEAWGRVPQVQFVYNSNCHGFFIKADAPTYSVGS